MKKNFLTEQQKQNYGEVDSFFDKGLYIEENATNEVLVEIFGSLERGRAFVNVFKKRIEDRVNEYGVSADEIIDLAKREKLYRYETFATDARRQNVYERAQGRVLDRVIRKLNRINGAEYRFAVEEKNTFPYYIDCEGTITLKNDRMDYTKQSKLFDFYVNGTKKNKPYKIFFFNKYTESNGGAQDDYQIEMLRTMEYCKKCKNKNAKFVFVLDGPYWENVKAKMTDTGDSIFVTDSDNLEEKLTELFTKL